MIHTRFALRRPVTTLMTFIALALIGIIAMRLLPLELFPDIRFPGIQVTIPYAGSTPEEVEQLITRPAEEAIATLSGIKEIRSTSSETGAELVVFFQWDRDPSAVGFEVRTKLESIRHEFPPSANRILTQMFAAGDDRVVAIRISSQEDLTRQYDTLDRYLKKPLERLDGVARVSLEGVEPLELRILVDPVRIAAHGVDIARLARRAGGRELLGQRRRDHRRRPALPGAPDRRVPHHRRCARLHRDRQRAPARRRGRRAW